MQQWEYLSGISRAKTEGPSTFWAVHTEVYKGEQSKIDEEENEWLNRHGLAGWDLISKVYVAMGFYLTLKRPIGANDS